SIDRISKHGTGYTLSLADGRAIETDLVVHGAGRIADIDSLNLEAAAIEFTRQGIVVDGYMTTSAPHVYAVGDAAATIQLARVADREAQVAAATIVAREEGLELPEPIDYRPVPAVLFSYPQLGMVGQTEAEFASAINTVCSNDRASIVIDDILFLNESNYQDDLISQAASQCVQQGIPYFTAAGNEGDQALRQTYRDSDPGSNDNGGNLSTVDLHDWDSGPGTDRFMAFTLPANSSLYVLLEWNQPNDSISPNRGAQIDLNLYATSSTDIGQFAADQNIVARGTNVQGDTGAPQGDAQEFIQVFNTNNAAQTFYLLVEHRKGSRSTIPQSSSTPLEFRVLFIDGRLNALEYSSTAPATWGHVLAANIFSVAAIPWWEAPDFAPQSFTTPDMDPEPFTSRGGSVPVQFNTRGDFIAQSRQTPSFSASDGNNTSFFGSPSSGSQPTLDGEPDAFPNFFGTSAASANAAAVAALVREKDASLTPAALGKILSDTAVDITGLRAGTGWDTVSGAGMLNALQAANQATPAPPAGDNG
ncbi:MAG: FAD-dependent oxidoreductase, partial [Oceanisphaera sp.]|nr:FAD-dependent oxidoreductase [Oceanisphaera sp.]